jgi:hypothetical protein
MLNPPKHYRDKRKIIGGEVVEKNLLKNISYDAYYKMFDEIFDWKERSRMGAKLMKKPKLIHKRIY